MSIAVTAAQSAFAVAARRPLTMPHVATADMSAARNTLGPRPTRRLYASTAMTAMTARTIGLARPRRASDTPVATRVMLKPEIASRWVVPVAANAAASEAGT